VQVIGLLKEAYEKAGLDLPMAPYGVLATDYECGIIEVRFLCVLLCASAGLLRPGCSN